jgi:hypothetical protein
VLTLKKGKKEVTPVDVPIFCSLECAAEIGIHRAKQNHWCPEMKRWMHSNTEENCVYCLAAKSKKEGA